MIDIMVLYILSIYDCSSYKIKKLINELFFAYAKSSSGSIVPSLKRLEELSCIEYKSMMTDGGMLKKTYSITPTGKKHFTDLISNYVIQNPANILNDAKILISCSSILNNNDLSAFKDNLKNNLELYEIKIMRAIKNEYNDYNETQIKMLQITMNETRELINLL